MYNNEHDSEQHDAMSDDLDSLIKSFAERTGGTIWRWTFDNGEYKYVEEKVIQKEKEDKK